LNRLIDVTCNRHWGDGYGIQTCALFCDLAFQPRQVFSNQCTLMVEFGEARGIH
jgi:hypothetical protein